MATRDAQEVVVPACVELELARTLFEAGNFAAAKKAVHAIVAVCPADRADVVQAEGLNLIARMAPDPWARRLTIGALIALVVLVINYVA